MKDLDPQIMNRMFLKNLDSDEHTKIAQQKFSAYIRDKIRDVQFARKILPPRNVTERDMNVQRSVNHDGLVYMDEIEPESGAGAVAWTGSPETRYIQAKRYEIPFFQISTDQNEITEQELYASRNPIHKMVEDRAVKDIGNIEDLRLLILCEAALEQTSQIVKGVAANAGVASGDIEIDDIVSLKNILVNEERPDGPILLCNKADYNKLLKWEAEYAGDKWRGDITYGNLKPTNIMGLTVVVTAKTSLLREGDLYLFAPPEWLGRFMILDEMKFFMRKERDLIYWSTWEFLAMSIANFWSVAKLEIYSGDSRSLPNEEDLFTSNISTPPSSRPTVVTY